MRSLLLSLSLGVLSVLLMLVETAQSRDWRPALIPNGDVYVCLNCHMSEQGGDARNPFGQSVEQIVQGPSPAEFWDASLAGMDSDGDGFANGVELQDPSGAWQPDQSAPGNPALVSNPGDENSIPPGEEPTATSTPVATVTEVPTPTVTPTAVPTSTPPPFGLAVDLELVVEGLTSPTGLTHANDGSGRLFVTDQVGQIRIIKDGSLLPEPFLNVADAMVSLSTGFDERGLLGLAFHPEYTQNGRFFVYYSAPTEAIIPGTAEPYNHKSIIAEYRVSPTEPDTALTTGIVLLEIEQPQFNHNAGQLAFGPDGYLYIGAGDGGGANDGLDGSPGHGEFGNGQDKNNLLGSILRIDVSQEGTYSIPPDNPFVGQEGRDEIWAYGLRNPFRFSFDLGGTQRLFCGDVGQSRYEEINIIEKGKNYGWRIMEGLHCFDPPAECDSTGLELPIVEYDHDVGVSVAGGYVYRGSQFPALVGKYVFGDWSLPDFSGNGHLFYLDEPNPGQWELFQLASDGDSPLGVGRFILSFGQDEAGEIYVLSKEGFGPEGNTGQVHRIVSPSVPADLDGDGKVDAHDLYLFMQQWHEGSGN